MRMSCDGIMNEIAISVDRIGKKYHIGGPSKKYDRLGDQLVDAVVAPFRRVNNYIMGRTSSAANLQEIFWALKDVSFEVKKGEVLGIIGRNGAGKSTLLKILSRITEPTEGMADIYGRVGSLLEVGTGFHPELTGMENIYLNGAILGMNRKEIEKKMSNIVEFAEIGQFLNTPVKYYSSGMYVRLAFSVAAHLEPEILMIDEVLAVGDMAFQKKCLGKMGDVAKEGRTVIFVSHNMGLIRNICDRGILLEQGMVSVDLPINEAVDAYLQTIEQVGSISLQERIDRSGQGKAKLLDLDVKGGKQGESSAMRTGDYARFVFHVSNSLPDMYIQFSIYDNLGQPVAKFVSKERSPEDIISPKTLGTYICEIDQLLIRPGRYRMDVGLVGDGQLQDFIVSARFFDVVEGLVNGRPVIYNKTFPVCIPHKWTIPNKN